MVLTAEPGGASSKGLRILASWATEAPTQHHSVEFH
jgi:hypothetical protein